MSRVVVRDEAEQGGRMAKALGEQQRSGIGRDWNQAGALDAGTMAEMNGPKE